MGTFEEQRQHVTVQAARAGYGLKRNNRPPYGWELFTILGHEPVVSGSLDELEDWLADQQEKSGAESGSDRRTQ